jgi:putative phosphoesterase
MKIGLISDTHGFLEESVFTYFKDVDEIWHAGDIGTVEVLEKLENFKPTKAVYGNIDGQEIRIRTKEWLAFYVDQKRVLIIHIGDKPPRYNPRVRKAIAQIKPDVIVCGHSHLLKVEFDKVNNLLFINPGAAGKHGFHKMKTLVRFEIEGDRMFNMEVIELGPRAAI